MSGDTTQAMQEALRAAVNRMSDSNGGGKTAAVDPIGLLAAVLPKLLESKDEREDVLDKLEGLEKETFSPLQEEIHGMRKQLHRVSKLQQQLVAELRELRQQQTAVGNAVLHLAQQMARVQIVDDLPEEDDDLLDDDGAFEDLSPAIAVETARVPGKRNKRPRPRRRRE